MGRSQRVQTRVRKEAERILRILVVLMRRQTRVLHVRNNELIDLEGFVMSPGQDIPVANENAIIILVVSASKIKRRFARRICHQNNGLCPRHGFSFWARWFSPASTCFSNTFLEVLLPALRMTNVECRLDQLRGKITVLELKREEPPGSAQGVEWENKLKGIWPPKLLFRSNGSLYVKRISFPVQRPRVC